jgi:hypothetical protein
VLADVTIQIYRNGTPVTTFTMSSTDKAFFNTKGGKIGIWSIATPQTRFDDFGGGTLTP